MYNGEKRSIVMNPAKKLPTLLLTLAIVFVVGPIMVEGAYQTAETIFVDSGSPATITGVGTGTGSGRAIVIHFTWRIDRHPSVTATIGGEAMTVLEPGEAIPDNPNQGVASFVLINPTVEGDQDLVITGSGDGDSEWFGQVIVIDGVDPNQSAPTPTIATGNTSPPMVSSVTRSSSTGNQIVFMVAAMSSDTSYSGTPTNFTERAEVNGGGFGFVIGDADGASSVDGSVTFDNTGTGGWVMQAVDFTPAISVSIRRGLLRLFNSLSVIRNGFIRIGN